MIKANEIRIGNWIADRGLKEWQIDHWDSINKVASKAHTTMCMGVMTETHPLTEYVDYLKPIPLTEIWLEKLGLIKKNITEDMPQELKQPDIDEDGSIWYHWVQGLFNLEIQENGEIWFELYSHYKHIKYVHELQNLYYALTGVELSVS